MAEKARSKQKTSGGSVFDVLFVTLRSLFIVIFAAGLAATIFSWWTASDFLPKAARDDLSVAQATSAAGFISTALPVENWERRIGIVAGHAGYDPGAVCEDGSGLTEAEVNYDIAQLVVQTLRGLRYEVDLLDEFDAQLDSYRATALVSIHADSCEYINDIATGFKVAGPAGRIAVSTGDQRLVQCLTERYAAATGLRSHASVTDDMSYYHSFDEISPDTPAAIIEVGFLYLDRDLLTQHTDLVAQGIVDGILCHLEAQAGTPTPAPDGEN